MMPEQTPEFLDRLRSTEGRDAFNMEQVERMMAFSVMAGLPADVRRARPSERDSVMKELAGAMDEYAAMLEPFGGVHPDVTEAYETVLERCGPL